MSKWKIYNEDAVEWAKNYQKAKFHAMFCDAPYHLTTITKRFGKKNSAPVKVDEFFDGYGQSKGSSPYSRTSKGFMGQQWDGGELAFLPETWEAFGEVLHPGAFGMAFSASRNWHRMAVAIEDAGFILHPTIFLWAYGQGFPKATNISKQIKTRGNATYPDTELSDAWQGHRYGLQALKPAVEPIIVFQKPYDGRPLDNIVQTGAGALNIDGARIPLETGDEYTINTFDDGAKPWGNGAGHKYTSKKVGRPLRKHTNSLPSNGVWGEGLNGSEAIGETTQGRWPANLILDGSGERLDAQTGELKSGSGIKGNSPNYHKDGEFQVSRDYRPVGIGGDTGGASRFFYNVSQQLDESDPVYYCGKVSPKERNAGLDDMDDVNYAVSDGARKQIERGEDEYLQDSIGINRVHKVKNPHPTLKPIDLCRYLATLLLPPDGYAPRRIFIPFSGVASEMIGAGLAGWEHIVGVEFDKENGYVGIAEKRLQHWLKENK